MHLKSTLDGYYAVTIDDPLYDESLHVQAVGHVHGDGHHRRLYGQGAASQVRCDLQDFRGVASSCLEETLPKPVVLPHKLGGVSSLLQPEGVSAQSSFGLEDSEHNTQAS